MKPSIKITGRKQNINKEEINKKPSHSNFLITLNLNQQYHKDEHKQNIDTDMEIFFAWPKPFESEYSRFELIPLYDRRDD